MNIETTPVIDSKMPLSEPYRSINGKNEVLPPHQKSNDISYIPNDEFMELIWERGQIMMQGQSSKGRKSPVSSNFQFQTPKFQEKDGLLAQSIQGIGLNQDDDMVPWFNYPLDDYCSEILPELSGVTVHEPLVHKDPSSVIGLHQLNSSKGSRTSNLFSFSDPTVRSGVSDNGNTNYQTKPHKDPVVRLEKPVQKQNSVLNFSHFSRPAARASATVKSNVQTHNCHGAVNVVNHEPPKEIGSVKVGSQRSGLEPINELHCADKSTNEVNGGKETVKSNEPVRACSSLCSGNSAERASNNLTKCSKRKSRDLDESECQSQGDEEESRGTKTACASRNRTNSKRSRAAEVHNLSERRRRDRINEKMRALQELIPNCNKVDNVDKASMLDEAIEYLKTLQIQVQIMSMGTGLCMPPMMFPTGMQHMGMSYGMGMGMGMEINGPGPHMFPFSPAAHGTRHTVPLPSIYGHTSHGMPMLLPQPPMPGIPIYPAARQVDIPDLGPSSRDPMHNKNPAMMAYASSQSQDANKIFNLQSTSVHDTRDRLSETSRRSTGVD